MSAAAETVRTHVIFQGRVQGVFFRATSLEIARGFAVTGFVRNLADGTVELEAQGAPDQVRGLIDAIREQYAANITNVGESPAALLDHEPPFRVR